MSLSLNCFTTNFSSLLSERKRFSSSRRKSAFTVPYTGTLNCLQRRNAKILPARHSFFPILLSLQWSSGIRVLQGDIGLPVASGYRKKSTGISAFEKIDWWSLGNAIKNLSGMPRSDKDSTITSRTIQNSYLNAYKKSLNINQHNVSNSLPTNIVNSALYLNRKSAPIDQIVRPTNIKNLTFAHKANALRQQFFHYLQKGKIYLSRSNIPECFPYLSDIRKTMVFMKAIRHVSDDKTGLILSAPINNQNSMLPFNKIDPVAASNIAQQTLQNATVSFKNTLDTLKALVAESSSREKNTVTFDGGIHVQIKAETVDSQNAEQTARKIADKVMVEINRIAEQSRFRKGLPGSRY